MKLPKHVSSKFTLTVCLVLVGLCTFSEAARAGFATPARELEPSPAGPCVVPSPADSVVPNAQAPERVGSADVRLLVR